MKYTFSLLALAASASAAVLPRGSSCTCSGFTLTASGGKSGVVGQLGDGQNRIGRHPPAKYNLCGGKITDANGRGCILTPPTTQFQCDVGAKPDGGFSLSSTGGLLLNGSPTFYACNTGDNNEYNIYSKDGANTNCVKVTLQTSCKVAPKPQPKPTQPKKCPVGLYAGFEFPHLIIPIDSKTPHTAYRTSYNGEVSSTKSSIFNFDIPASDKGKTCSLVFLFPQQKDLETSSYKFSGSGKIQFYKLKSPAVEGQTSYSNQPAVEVDYGVRQVAPGGKYGVADFPCPAGQRISFKMRSTDHTYLWYFQDYNPSPIGLYINKC